MATGQMVRPTDNAQPQGRDNIDWRDGANHRYKAQRDIVDGKPQR